MTKKNTLDRVYLKTPCSTEWSLMEGNAQIRSCSECCKLVYNLSSMTRKQVEDLIANAGGEICAKFERNDRGKIVTADQAIHSPFFRMRLPLFMKAAVSALLGIAITVQAEVRSNSYDIVSSSMVRSLKDTTDKTQTQDGKPAIGGSVFDARKAVIAGATMTLVNDKSNHKHIVTTSEDGQYRFAKIEPGTYSLKIEARGFVQLKKTGIELRADQDLRIDVTLQVGTVGGLALLPNIHESKPMLKVPSLPIRAIKKALRINS